MLIADIMYLNFGGGLLKVSKTISEAVIRRMPVYHRHLQEVIDKGIERISSSQLSKLTGFTASQIRQDLNNFGGFGQQGYGYKTVELKEQIDSILGMDKTFNTIIIGAGSLGTAIAKYQGFKNSGFIVKSLFDIKEHDDVEDIKVRNMDELEEFIGDNNIDVAIITVPKSSAEAVAKRVVNCGVKGIWNFAPVDLNLPSDIVVENVRLNDSLLILSYYMKGNK